MVSQVPALMAELEAFLAKRGRLHPVAHAAQALYRLSVIHPFMDGNGRTARLMMNLLLLQAGYPPAIIRKCDRDAYVQCLVHGEEGGGLEPIHRLVCEAVDRGLDHYLEAAS